LLLFNKNCEFNLKKIIFKFWFSKKFKIFIFKEPDATENVVSIDQDYLRSRNTVEKYLNNENEVEIFLDFLELNYLDPEEVLKIKLINF